MLLVSRELRTPFLIHQPGSRIGEIAIGITLRFPSVRLEENRPARTEPFQNIVRARAGGNQFRFRCALKVWPAKTECALETAVLVEDHAGRDECGPGQVVSNAIGAGRSEEHTSELQSLMRISYAVFCLKKKKTNEKLKYTSP